MKLCTGCAIEKPLDDYYADRRATDGMGSRCRRCHNSGTRKWAQANQERVRTYDQRARLRLRLAAVAALGGFCTACGISDPRVLEIDHINGGGSQEFRTIGSPGVQRKLAAGDTAGYQLLCANCHNIKTFGAFYEGAI